MGNGEHGASAGTQPSVTDPLERGPSSQVSAQLAPVGRRGPLSLQSSLGNRGPAGRSRATPCVSGAHTWPGEHRP